MARELARAARRRRRASTSASARRRCAPATSTFDLATTRREPYDEPGALPRVAAGAARRGPRRGATSPINAMAVGLTGDDLGHLYDPHGGRDDLEAGLIRVLHPDSLPRRPHAPAARRPLRGPRSASAWTRRPSALAREAVAGARSSTVSGPRVRDELMDLLGEHEAPGGGGADARARARPRAAPGPRPRPGAGGLGVARRSRRAAPTAALVRASRRCRAGARRSSTWLARGPAPARPRDRTPCRARRARAAARWRSGCTPASSCPRELHALLGCEPPRGAGARAGVRRAGGAVLRWVTDLRGVAARDHRRRPARRRHPRGPGDRPGAGGDAQAQARRRGVRPRRRAAPGAAAGARGPA